MQMSQISRNNKMTKDTPVVQLDTPIFEMSIDTASHLHGLIGE